MTNWMFTTNHKRIGIFYIWFGLFSGLLGMMLALAIRLELSSPGNQVFENNKWVVNVILTAHSFIMFSLVGIKCYRYMPSVPYPTLSHFLYLMWLYFYIKGYCEFGGLIFVDNNLYADSGPTTGPVDYRYVGIFFVILGLNLLLFYKLDILS